MTRLMRRRGGLVTAAVAMLLADVGAGLAAESSRAAAPVADRWAVVKSDGALARHSGAKASARLGRGIYEVDFKSSVGACVYQATLGNPGAGNPPLGLVSVAPRLRAPSKVLVVTRNTAGRPISAGFHLFVSCPDTPPAFGGTVAEARLATSDRWASLDYDATIMRSRGAVSAAMVPPATEEAYEVIFGKDVTACAYLASPMTLSDPLTTPEVVFGVARRSGEPAGVYVRPPLGVATAFSVVAKCPTTRAAPRTHSADRWAVVNANGTIARGFGVISADNYQTGHYELKFARGTLPDWPRSAHLVTIGTASASSTLPPSGSALGIDWYASGNHLFVGVATRNASGAFANRPFHVYIVGR
jgi:hypothetical protein